MRDGDSPPGRSGPMGPPLPGGAAAGDSAYVICGRAAYTPRPTQYRDGAHDPSLPRRRRRRRSRARQAADRGRRGPAGRRARAARVGRRPHRRRPPHRARAARLRGRLARPRPPGALLLPPRRALGHGRERVPPRRVRRVLDRRRADRMGPARAIRSSPRTARSPTTDALRVRDRAIAAALLLLGPRGRAAAAPAPVPVGTFAQPVHVAAPPGDASRVFVVEQAGRVQVVVDGQRAATPFLDIADERRAPAASAGCSRSRSRPTTPRAGCSTSSTPTQRRRPRRRARDSARADPNRGDPAPRSLFTVPHPASSNHNGGQLAFGPGRRAVRRAPATAAARATPGTTRSTRTACSARSSASTRAAARRRQIWALGLRNPWRFSFDRATGDMVIGDVGGGVNEEVDIAPAGRRPAATTAGGRCEGDQPSCPRRHRFTPVLNLPHRRLHRRDRRLRRARPRPADARGRYVFGDLSKATVMSAALGTERVPRPEPTLPVSGADLVRRGRLRPRVRRLVDGRGLPHPGRRAVSRAAADRSRPAAAPARDTDARARVGRPRPGAPSASSAAASGSGSVCAPTSAAP